MAYFLRDEQVANVTIDAGALRQLADAFATHAISMPEYSIGERDQPRDVFLTFTIRFDEKGYRVFDAEQLLRHFGQAARVERVIFELQSGASLRTNRVTGSYADLRLDGDDRVTCFLTVTSDDESWVQSSFSGVKEVLARHRNRSSLIRNAWVELLIQLVGVALGFVFSVWGAARIAPNLTIENAFLISFILALLVYSNFWTYVNQRLRALVFGAFPSIRFYRSERDSLHWLYQAVIGGLVVAAALFLLNWTFSYVGRVLGRFVG